MRISFNSVSRNAELFARLTGLTLAEFAVVLPKFEAVYDKLVVEPRLSLATRQRGAGGGRRGWLPGAEDKLFFVLVYARTYPTLLVQGVLFGMAESRACTWVGALAPCLDEALGEAGVRPAEAHGCSLDELAAGFGVIVLDGVERPVRRPRNKAAQKARYSGKKKRHTVKNVDGVVPTQRVVALSAERDGSVHDKRVTDEEELVGSNAVVAHGDSGLQGLSVGEARVVTPTKKPRGKPLNPRKRVRNKRLASRRAVVEHAHAGIKRSRVVADVFRGTREGASSQFMFIATGLHNLRVDTRDSYQLSACSLTN
jgi:hypothetical protein